MMTIAFLWCATLSLAQKYTVMDLGTLGGTYSVAAGINNSGQVIGYAAKQGDVAAEAHAFRTAPNSAINPITDDLGTLGGTYSQAYGINDSGQVVGRSWPTGLQFDHAFRTAPNRLINPSTDDIGTLGGPSCFARAINTSGQVIGDCDRAFRTAPNSVINPATDDLGTLGGTYSEPFGINASGQVVGYSALPGDQTIHAFRTRPNRPIDPSTDDLGTLGGVASEADDINDSGQVVGSSNISGNIEVHAFRTAPNSPINPATDDLGTLAGTTESNPHSINASGQVVGSSHNHHELGHAFLYSGAMYDLNDLIPAGSGWVLHDALGINDAGQIAGWGMHNGVQRAFLLTPVPTSVPFAQFKVKLNVSGTPPINQSLKADFTLGTGSDGIDWTKDWLFIEFGPAWPGERFEFLYVRPSSWKQNKKGWLTATVTGYEMTYAFRIVQTGSRSYTLQMEGFGNNFTGAPNPVQITLTIRNDAGTASVRY